MPDLTLDLRYLKYAVQVAEAGSFRRAAERLSISQSTVSRRVQLFERQLGFSLFKRTRAGAGLTPEGERFLQQAVVGARYLRNAATEIRSARKLKTGLVRFGMLEAFPACPIINILSAFRNRHPTIEVKLEEGTSEENTLGGEARITGRSNQPECEQEPSVPSSTSLRTRSVRGIVPASRVGSTATAVVGGRL